MMKQLRPAILDELGLVNTLSQLVDEWNERHPECACSFDAAGDDAALSDSVSINIYRIVQEALTNAAKHAQCSDVRVELNLPDAPQGFIDLQIRDNGRGIEPNERTQGLGLIGIRERVDALGGSFEMRTRTGVALVIRLPFNGGVDEHDQSITGR
jgi:signal transduction histidine kinase